MDSSDAGTSILDGLSPYGASAKKTQRYIPQLFKTLGIDHQSPDYFCFYLATESSELHPPVFRTERHPPAYMDEKECSSSILSVAYNTKAADCHAPCMELEEAELMRLMDKKDSTSSILAVACDEDWQNF